MFKYFLTPICIILAVCSISGQVVYNRSALAVNDLRADSVSFEPAFVDDALFARNFTDTLPYDTLPTRLKLHKILRLPAVYTNFKFDTGTSAFPTPVADADATSWVDNGVAASDFESGLLQRYFFNHPDRVRYNMASLETPAQEFHAVINPADHTIKIHQRSIPLQAPTIKPEELKERHWIHAFAASLQFSQAYISPNWYQGGNNNLNMLLNVNYNVKLNQAYHPNLLFETNVQYKLGLYSTPDDSLRNYSISEDLLQINSTFGLKAARRWYYSVNVQFKTQLFNSYNTNTCNLRSAFLSPADLNVGLGMTYNYANPKKTFTFDASLAPLSYNMRMCTTDRMNHEQFNIRQNRTTAHHFGSSCELKLSWAMAQNIKYTSRLFAFTDYDRAYADWEHTVVFEINKFLTTQLYAHLRYDTATAMVDGSRWRKFQVKEILSLGIAYKFSSL